MAIRAGHLSDSSLIARKLAPSRRAFVASPDYLAKAGVPETLADLSHHDCVISGRSVDGASWLVHGPDGAQTVSVKGRIAVNTMQFAVRAAICGLGIALIPSPLAASAVQAGQLQAVLREFEPPHGALYAVYPSNRQMSAAVSSFVDFVANRMAWLRSADVQARDPLLVDIAAGI